jgi:hypothetical protein
MREEGGFRRTLRQEDVPFCGSLKSQPAMNESKIAKRARLLGIKTNCGYPRGLKANADIEIKFSKWSTSEHGVTQ